MSVCAEDDSSRTMEDEQGILEGAVTKETLLDPSNHETGQGDKNDGKAVVGAQSVYPLAFTVDFGDGKQFDKSRLEELAKKSQMRHQRVQSMSASLTRPNPIAQTIQRPPLSAKLPRKAQGYNSEGYFSSDQEDSCLSGSVKLKLNSTSFVIDRPKLASPVNKVKSPLKDKNISKSPIVDSIMSRSDSYHLRQNLSLPLRNINSVTFVKDIYRTPSYGNLSSYQPPSTMTDIIDQSPEGVLLTDISSPEFDVLTPDNGVMTPEKVMLSPQRNKQRAMSATPDLLLQQGNNINLYIDDDIERQSNNSSTGTYTIETDNYTQEQKARMSIDRSFNLDTVDSSETILKTRCSKGRDPELIYDFNTAKTPQVANSPLFQRKTNSARSPSERNVLEVSCYFESPEKDLAAQTSKQIKSTRSYLEKIKNRVKNITEKTFAKQHGEEPDIGSFTSMTTSGVLSSNSQPKFIPNRRRCSLTKSEIDQTDYVHRLSRETSVPVCLPSALPFNDTDFESTALKNAHRVLKDDSGISSDITPDHVVGRLSYLSLNRCKGDKGWIQDWAESVKMYNKDVTGPIVNDNFSIDDKPPHSPRREKTMTRSAHSSGATPTKIPSPVGTLRHRLTPDLIPSIQDTDSYLQKTQNAITNLQAKLHSTKPTKSTNSPPTLTTSLIIDKTASSKLPVSQLSRSNSLNYRLKHRETTTNPNHYGKYVVIGSNLPETTKILLKNASKSLEERTKDANFNSGDLSTYSSERTLRDRSHARNLSFDSRNYKDFLKSDLNNANSAVSLKTVLRNAELAKFDQTRSHGNVANKYSSFGSSIKRSSSFNAVNRNNNIESRISNASRGYGDRLDNSQRMSEPPTAARTHQSRITSDASRQAVFNRLTASRSSTREPVKKEKGPTKPTPRPWSSSSKQVEFSNWKKRASYDPMKAAQDARKRQQAKMQESNKDDMSSPSHSSPVHRSKSFHTTIDYSSDTDDDNIQHIDDVIVTDIDDVNDIHHVHDVMATSTMSDNLHERRKGSYSQRNPKETLKNSEKRITYIVDDDVTPTRDNVDLLKDNSADKRRTFVLDSDTNSTTNGSSPRNSSIFSQSKQYGVTGSDSDSTDQPVILRSPHSRSKGKQSHRHSGDYSMSSSTTSLGQNRSKSKEIQPRYLDISKYKNESSKNFLRRDPSKTYVAVLNNDKVSKGSAQQYEMEQKKQELEKWKRRASYDPRKAAALGKTKPQPKTASNVLRSQSFHGPVLAANMSCLRSSPSQILEKYDASSDNDF